MNHLKYDIRNAAAGSTVVVELDRQANVLLMDAGQYGDYKAGRRYSYRGGGATRSPVRLSIPRGGHWIVVVDTGGLPGRVNAKFSVVPPAPGLLPPIRTKPATPAGQVALHNPEDPEGDVLGGQTWDVFLSHASEDKADVARPLRDALVAAGVSVWLDAVELRVGDSLRRRIDQGIRSSKFGVIVLSPSFFEKGWTNHELDGIVTRNVAGEQSMLPIWHGVTADDVRRYSPSLADKVALSTSEHSMQDIAEQIAQVVSGGAI